MEALRRKRDFVGGTVGGALAGMAYGVSGMVGPMIFLSRNALIPCGTVQVFHPNNGVLWLHFERRTQTCSLDDAVKHWFSCGFCFCHKFFILNLSAHLSFFLLRDV